MTRERLVRILRLVSIAAQAMANDLEGRPQTVPAPRAAAPVGPTAGLNGEDW